MTGEGLGARFSTPASRLPFPLVFLLLQAWLPAATGLILQLPENGSVANYRLMWGTHSQAHQKSCIIKPSSTLSHLPQDLKTFCSPGVKKTPSS